MPLDTNEDYLKALPFYKADCGSPNTNMPASAQVKTPAKRHQTPNKRPRHSPRPSTTIVQELDPHQLSDAADKLRRRYKRLNDLDHLKDAIALYRRALQLVRHDHPDKPYWLDSMGRCLRYSFDRSGEAKYIESSISAHRDAVDHTVEGHAELPGRLGTLAISLWARFNRFGEPTDLESTLETERRAVALTPEDDPELPRQLSNLAGFLSARFKRFGEPTDLESALETDRRAVALMPDGHPELPLRLSNLAESLTTRFERFGEHSDLESALETHRRAVALTPEDDPDLPGLLSNLANSLWTRFDRFGEPSDLGSALQADRRAVALTPDGDPELPLRLSNLATSLCARFDRFGEPSDLKSALETDRRAVALTPDDDPDLPGRLSNLANSLGTRFDRFGEPTDLKSALETDRRAVALTPEDDPELPQRLSNLAGSFMTLFNSFGESKDLENAIEADQRAVKLTPEGHPSMSSRMHRLGYSLESRFMHDRVQNHFDEAVECYLAAATQPLGDPKWRFESAQAYVRLLTDHPEFRALHSLLLAHSHIMDVLPGLVWVGHSVQRRFEESAHIGGLVNAAVSVAIESGDLAWAVGWLEAGRSFIWSQVASMRTPLDDLAEQHPEAAHDLHELHGELQQLGIATQANIRASTNHDIARDGLARRDVYVESAADRYRRGAIRYDALMKDIRSRDGFEDFMRPKKLADFIALPAFARLNGAVVFINVAELTCDALILLPSGAIKEVRLPGLSRKRADQMRTIWTETVGLRRAHRRGSVPLGTDQVRGSSNVYTRVLSRLWTLVVQPILAALDFIKEKEEFGIALPHLIWCPTGPLTQLPLHAAGEYTQRQRGPRTFDFVVSSYTPSLSALVRCLEKNVEHRSSLSMLVVAQTNTPRPGLAPLPEVRDESARIRALLDGDKHIFLEDEQATVDAVLAAINQHTWVHFACHGSQHPNDPTLTSVELHDKPLTLGDLMNTVVNNAELAFLSACETAVGDKKVPEESAHLAAGMLAVGFKGVVATMWSIYDEDGPVIVEAYYKKLLELRASGTVPQGHTGAAYALHYAAEVLRKEVGESSFERWVPFVHFGV